MGGSMPRVRVALGRSAAILGVTGIVSAGVVSGDDGTGADQVIVAAAGHEAEVVERQTTTPTPPTAAVAPATTPPAPPTTVTRTTTAARSAAPATTATSVAPGTPAPTAAAPPAPAAVAGPARVTLVNQYAEDVAVTLNGQPFRLGPGQIVGPVAVAPSAGGSDTVELAVAADPSCGQGDADRLFAAGRAYRFTVSAGPGQCRAGVPGPGYRVTPA